MLLAFPINGAMETPDKGGSAWNVSSLISSRAWTAASSIAANSAKRWRSPPRSTAAGEAAQAQASRGFKVIGINHMSYTCPDYLKARDWYSSVLNMKSEQTRDDGNRANMMFGPEQGKGGTFLVARTPKSVASGATGIPSPASRR